MNENLNLVELLKDCPKGTKLYSPALGECALEGVNDNNDYPIKVKYKIINNDTRVDYFTKYGYLLINKPDAECMLFPSKGQRDWSKWQRPFVKGDVLVSNAGNIVLCSHIDERQLVHYHCILKFSGILKIRDDIGVGYSYECTLANDFQKQKLFDVLKKEGYKWDAETKTLEKLKKEKLDIKTCQNCNTFKVMHQNCPYSPIWTYKDLNVAKLHLNDETNCEFWREIPETNILENNKFDPKTLKPFESRILVSTRGKWVPAIFGHYNKEYTFPIVVVGGNVYTKCIPYEGNEYLIDTYNQPSEFYRYWED